MGISVCFKPVPCSIPVWDEFSITVRQAAACNPEPICLEWRRKKIAKLFVDFLAENGDLWLKLVGEFMHMDDL
jgi:hypothetical protein